MLLVLVHVHACAWLYVRGAHNARVPTANDANEGAVPKLGNSSTYCAGQGAHAHPRYVTSKGRVFAEARSSVGPEMGVLLTIAQLKYIHQR